MSDQAYSFLVAGGLFALSAFLVWMNLRMRADDRAARSAREQRARAARRPSGYATFDAGAVAALDGVEAWENPHCTPSGMAQDATAWAAGWCYGRQLLRDAWRARD